MILQKTSEIVNLQYTFFFNRIFIITPYKETLLVKKKTLPRKHGQFTWILFYEVGDCFIHDVFIMITLNYRGEKKSHGQRCTREAESKTLPGSLSESHWVISAGATCKLLQI